MFTENGNRPRGWGMLDPAQFRPFSKNPPIAKVFREVSLADELGSGTRNTYKYTKLYSGGEPQFIEGDLFRTIIPLKPVATAKVGPGVNSDQENHQEPISNRIIEFCSTARSKKEIAAFLGYKDIGNLTRRYIAPLVAEGLLKMTEPDILQAATKNISKQEQSLRNSLRRLAF